MVMAAGYSIFSWALKRELRAAEMLLGIMLKVKRRIAAIVSQERAKRPRQTARKMKRRGSTPKRMSRRKIAVLLKYRFP
jgi:hypothetical protein